LHLVLLQGIVTLGGYLLSRVATAPAEATDSSRLNGELSTYPSGKEDDPEDDRGMSFCVVLCLHVFVWVGV
jgi:hypothetical protein